MGSELCLPWLLRSERLLGYSSLAYPNHCWGWGGHCISCVLAVLEAKKEQVRRGQSFLPRTILGVISSGLRTGSGCPRVRAWVGGGDAIRVVLLASRSPRGRAQCWEGGPDFLRALLNVRFSIEAPLAFFWRPSGASCSCTFQDGPGNP